MSDDHIVFVTVKQCAFVVCLLVDFTNCLFLHAMDMYIYICSNLPTEQTKKIFFFKSNKNVWRSNAQRIKFRMCKLRSEKKNRNKHLGFKISSNSVIAIVVIVQCLLGEWVNAGIHSGQIVFSNSQNIFQLLSWMFSFSSFFILVPSCFVSTYHWRLFDLCVDFPNS